MSSARSQPKAAMLLTVVVLTPEAYFNLFLLWKHSH